MLRVCRAVVSAQGLQIAFCGLLAILEGKHALRFGIQSVQASTSCCTPPWGPAPGMSLVAQVLGRCSATRLKVLFWVPLAQGWCFAACSNAWCFIQMEFCCGAQLQELRALLQRAAAGIGRSILTMACLLCPL